MRFASVAVLSMLMGAEAFMSSTLPKSQTPGLTVSYGYVPDGFTPESYAEFKKKEAAKMKTKNLGGLGPRGFKSRSMQSFQEALERGEASHLLPVFNAEEKIRKGELKPEDIPYMQRGGSWDNSDIKGAKKKRWLKSDVEYANGGYKKEQSVSIFGYGEGLDWTGQRSRRGPSESVVGAAPKFSKNYKAPNVYQMKGVKSPPKEEAPKKKFFGLF